jgi:proteasome lid subunit RPN8/RPN11
MTHPWQSPRRLCRRSNNLTMTETEHPATSGNADEHGPTESAPESALHDHGRVAPREWTFPITQGAFLEAMSYLGGRAPEAAGILLGPRNDEPLVTRFVPDLIGQGNPVAFELHGPFLNHVLQDLKPQGLTVLGVIHSHPNHFSRPSSGDLEYFQRLFARPANARATHLFVPIVCDRQLYPYVYVEGRVAPATLVVV